MKRRLTLLLPYFPVKYRSGQDTGLMYLTLYEFIHWLASRKHRNMLDFAVDAEPFTYKLTRGLGREDVFIDVGANVGVWLMIARYCKLILAIEPSKYSFGVLLRNTKEMDNIRLFQMFATNHPGETIDDVTSSMNLPLTKIALIKIDVEGAEFEVLEGSRDTLRLTNKVLVEVHGARELMDLGERREQAERLKSLLGDNNFQVREIQQPNGMYLLAERNRI